MSTLTKDIKRDFDASVDPHFEDYLAIVTDIVYEGAAVTLETATGHARPASIADTVFAGFAVKQADNSTGLAGAINVQVRTQGKAKLAVTGASAVTDVGKKVYLTDDATFTLTAAGGLLIGRVVRWISSTNCIVFFAATPLDIAGKTKDVEAHTADDTLTPNESGSVHSTVGASGTVVLTLPAATVGMEFFFYVGAAQELRIDPDGSELISLPSTGVPGAAGKYLTADLAGETVHLVCAVAGSWSVMGFTGTWAAEG